MTEKDCHSHCHDHKKKLYLRIIYGVIAFVVVVCLVILLFWAITKPSKPSFVLQDVTVSNFSLSNTVPAYLSTTLQITIITKNPNDKIGVYYQSAHVYASYRSQQITPPTSLPTTYQDHKDVSVWSPFLCGNEVPISPFVGTALSQDLNTGRLLVHIKVDGRIKWKVGTWMSSKYHLHANCPAYIMLGGVDHDDPCKKPADTTVGGDCSKGIAFDAPIKYQFAQRCNVEVAL